MVVRGPKARIFTEKEMDQKGAYLGQIRDMLNDQGVWWQLVLGAALGATREKDFIPYDFDVDIAMKAEEALPIKKKIVERLKNLGFEVKVKQAETTGEDTLIQFEQDPLYGHILLYYKSKNEGLRQQKPVKEAFQTAWLPEIFFAKPGRAKLRGEEYPVPANIKKYLRWQYNDWKTPTNAGVKVFRQKRTRNEKLAIADLAKFTKENNKTDQDSLRGGAG